MFRHRKLFTPDRPGFVLRTWRRLCRRVWTRLLRWPLVRRLLIALLRRLIVLLRLGVVDLRSRIVALRLPVLVLRFLIARLRRLGLHGAELAWLRAHLGRGRGMHIAIGNKRLIDRRIGGTAMVDIGKLAAIGAGSVLVLQLSAHGRRVGFAKSRQLL